MNLHGLIEDVRTVRTELDRAHGDHRRHVREAAEAERAYRKARAQAWLRVKDQGLLARAAEDWVGAETSDDRYERDLASGLERAAIELVRSRRQELSSIQSELSAYREEAGLARTEPH